MLGLRKYNFRHNSERTKAPEFGRMINGQGLGRVSDFRYGICRMSFNGCEVIAVHNALVYINKPQPLAEIAFYMERFRVLLGFFGCNAYRLGQALEHYGAAFERYKTPQDAKAFIITFWNGIPLLSSIHTVFCVRSENGIKVYNMYNSCPDAKLCKTVEEIAGKRKPIAVYAIQSPNT